MMKFLIIVFAVFAVIGLYKSLAVTLISLLLIPFAVAAEVHFKKMDEEWECKHTPAPTEEILKDHPCNKM